MTPDAIVINLKNAGLIVTSLSFLLYGAYLLRRSAFAARTAQVMAGAGAGGGTITVSSGEAAGGVPGDRIGQLASYTQLLATVLLLASVAGRWIVAGRAPYANQYEFSVAFAAAAMVGYAVIERRYGVRTLGVFVLPVVLGLLAYSTTVPATIDPLIPALQNNLLLTVHVMMAVIAYGLFAVSFGCGLMYLFQGDGQKVSWLPSGQLLEQIAYRSITIAFPLLGMVLVLGAIWGNTAWGRFWAWDPKETATLATWLVYAVYLHTRAIVGWRGKKSAAILIVGFGMVLFTFFGVNLFIGGLHSYSGVQ